MTTAFRVPTALVASTALATAIAGCGKVWGFHHPIAATEEGGDAALDDAAADGAPDDFDVAKFPSIVLWLSADRELDFDPSTKRVRSWLDRSGHANHFANTDATAQPLLFPAAIGEQPAVRFDALRGDLLAAADSPSLAWGTKDFSLVAVVRHAMPAGQDDTYGYGAIFVRADVPQPPYPGVSLFANFPLPGPTAKIGAQVDVAHYLLSPRDANDGRPHLIVFRKLGVQLELSVDDAATTLTLDRAIDVSPSPARAFIGAHPGVNGRLQRLDGDVAEIMAANAWLGDSELSAIEGYLKSKYGL